MMTLREKAFGNAAEAQRMTEQGLLRTRAVPLANVAVRQFRQWSRADGRGSPAPCGPTTSAPRPEQVRRAMEVPF